MSDVMLSYAARGSLLSLNDTTKQMAEAERRLSSGREVNFAHDESYRYFTSEILQARATDLDDVNRHLTLNSQVLKAATSGLNTIKDFIENAEAQLRIAKDDHDGFSRLDFIDRYNTLLSQIEAVAENSEYKDKNLLNGNSNDDLKLIFNESYTTSHVVHSVNYTNHQTLGLERLSRGEQGLKTVVMPGAGTLYEGTELTSLTNGGNPIFEAGDEISFFDSETNRSLGSVTITSDMTAGEFTGLVTHTIDNVKAKLSGTTGAFDFDYTGGVVIQHNKDNDSARNGNEIDIGLGAEIETFSALGASVSANADLNGMDGFSLTTGDSIAVTFEGRTQSFTYGTDGTTLQDFMNFVNANVTDLHLYYDEAASEIKYIYSDGTGSTAAPTITLGGGATAGGTLFSAAPAGTPPLPASPVDEAVIKHDLHSNSDIDTLLLKLRAAKRHVENTERQFAMSLNLIETRIDFSQMMINTLEEGATELVEADTNWESTRLLTLQTRQQLAMSSLSMAAQADQSILRIFS